ncbi:MAG: 50S ribosomal protein L22 [Myxococcota bacterium]|nr:50S ribosomal protein L22 [Myxococcota bacterium]
MESKASLRYLKMTPRKVRAILNEVRGKPVQEAIDLLRFMPRAAATPVRKLIESAVQNARRQGQGDVDRLIVATAYADGGPAQRRFRPRAHGRAYRVLKRTSHVTVVLKD